MSPQLSPQLIGSVLIEAALIVMSTFLLSQPDTVFGGLSSRTKSAVTMAGMLALCVTFCWSVIFGCLLAIHQFTLRI